MQIYIIDVQLNVYEKKIADDSVCEPFPQHPSVLLTEHGHLFTTTQKTWFGIVFHRLPDKMYTVRN